MRLLRTSCAQHADFYVDLASFELLGFEYPSATIAAASLLCGLWNMKEESLEQPKRLSQVVQLLGSHEGSHLLGSKPGVVVEADVLACMQRLAKAFVTLEKDHARIAAEKAAKEDAEKHGTSSNSSKGKLTNPPVRPSTPSFPPPLSSTVEGEEPLPSAPSSASSLSSITRADSLESVCWPTRSESEAVANSEIAATVHEPRKDFVPVRESDEDEQTERSESPDGVITTTAFVPAPASFSAAAASTATGGDAPASSKAPAPKPVGLKRNAASGNDEASSRRQSSRRRRVV